MNDSRERATARLGYEPPFPNIPAALLVRRTAGNGKGKKSLIDDDGKKEKPAKPINEKPGTTAKVGKGKAPIYIKDDEDDDDDEYLSLLGGPYVQDE